MSTIRVETPNTRFSGKRLGYQFAKGVAEVPAELADAFQRLGYTVSKKETEEAPAPKRTRTTRARKTKEVSE